MKKLIVSLVLFSALLSCSEENPQPVDHFPGSWSFVSGDLALSFDVYKLDNGAYNIVNRSVSHPTLPPEEQDNNQAMTYDKFANGYGRIEINSRGKVNYFVHLIYNRFNEEGNMNVYDIIVQMPGQEQYVLMDQVLIKN